MERYIVKVSEKGQVVIPVGIRRKFGIKREIAFIDEEDRVTLVPFTPMEEAFGIDGDVMREIAREISEARRRELRLEGK